MSVAFTLSDWIVRQAVNAISLLLKSSLKSQLLQCHLTPLIDFKQHHILKTCSGSRLLTKKVCMGPLHHCSIFTACLSPAQDADRAPRQMGWEFGTGEAH